MVTNFVLSVCRRISGMWLCLMVPALTVGLVWRASRRFCLLDRPLSSGREPFEHCLACVFRHRHPTAAHRILFPYAHAHDAAVSTIRRPGVCLVKSLELTATALMTASARALSNVCFGRRGCCPTLSKTFTHCTGRVPYLLVAKRYWRALIGTCGAW